MIQLKGDMIGSPRVHTNCCRSSNKGLGWNIGEIKLVWPRCICCRSFVLGWVYQLGRRHMSFNRFWWIASHFVFVTTMYKFQCWKDCVWQGYSLLSQSSASSLWTCSVCGLPMKVISNRWWHFKATYAHFSNKPGRLDYFTLIFSSTFFLQTLLWFSRIIPRVILIMPLHCT